MPLRLAKAEILNSTGRIQIDVKSISCLAAIILLPFALSALAMGHVPLLAEENENITNAMHISDPVKSWAVYGTLNNAVHYYSIDSEEGERISVSLFKSTDPNEGDFQPAMVLLGPGLEGDRKALHLALPAAAREMNAIAAEEASAKSAVYEPFGPSSFLEISKINITAPQSARYYVAVYSGNNSSSSSSISSSDNSSSAAGGASGHYGLAIGFKEEFSFSDRIITPLRLFSVYLWEGQSLALILIPYFIAEIFGLFIFWRGAARTSFCLAATLAGFFFLATAATVLNQMVFTLTRAPFGSEVYITLAIALFNILLGVVTIRLARGEAGILQRALLAVLGTVALLAGSGLILGPILAMASSFLPSRKGSILITRISNH